MKDNSWLSDAHALYAFAVRGAGRFGVKQKREGCVQNREISVQNREIKESMNKVETEESEESFFGHAVPGS